MPVEAFVLRDLGPDCMLIENSVMAAFGGILDWEQELLTFRYSKVRLKATHKRTDKNMYPSFTSERDHCSVVRVAPQEPVGVGFSFKKMLYSATL